MTGLGMDIRYLTLKGETFPPNPFLLKEKKKNSTSNNQSLGRQIGTTFFFFFSPASLLFSVRNKTADLSHNSQIFGSIMLQETEGENQKVILKSFAFTHANKLYASQ